MDMLAKKLSFDEISVALTFDSVIASARRAGEWITMAREIGLPGGQAGTPTFQSVRLAAGMYVS
jgi:hypothetical protein